MRSAIRTAWVCIETALEPALSSHMGILPQKTASTKMHASDENTKEPYNQSIHISFLNQIS